MRHSAQPELSEREISRRLLKIYQVMGWPLPDQQNKDDRAPGPEKLRGTAAERAGRRKAA